MRKMEKGREEGSGHSQIKNRYYWADITSERFHQRRGNKAGQGAFLVALTYCVFKGQLKVARKRGKINLSHAALHKSHCCHCFWRENGLQTRPRQSDNSKHSPWSLPVWRNGYPSCITLWFYLKKKRTSKDIIHEQNLFWIRNPGINTLLCY